MGSLEVLWGKKKTQHNDPHQEGCLHSLLCISLIFLHSLTQHVVYPYGLHQNLFRPTKKLHLPGAHSLLLGHQNKKKTEDKWKEKKISSPVDHTVDTSCISTLHTLPAVRLSIRSFAYLSLVQIKMQLLPFELFLYIVQMQQDDNAQGYSTHIVCIEKPNSVDC